MFVDRKFRIARLWSNRELKKFAHLFKGTVVNVSGWTDIDKEGSTYAKYFKNADTYLISNYKAEARGFQGYKNEFFLDLTKKLPKKHVGKYEVIFNHTTLEHIYEVQQAFANLCAMTNDIVIVVVPFVQHMHSHYGDYWRFTPLAIKRMFEDNKMELLYLSFNHDRHASTYIFAIASKQPKKWKGKIGKKFSYKSPRDFLDLFENYAGNRAITNTYVFKVATLVRAALQKIFK
ncbi:MAG: hypothetical protein H6502_03160 [Candidatus Woesearchaeota archaeon]|nr:MAG: hypothetical protein H6502_03160 [Candidatus Woesearchaeota archaeon]